MQLNSTFYSSFVFLINAAVFYYYDTVYAILFFSLFISSIICHTRMYVNSELYQTSVYYIDQMFIFMIFLYGSYVLYTKLCVECIFNYKTIVMASLAFITFFSTILLYHVGYSCSMFCWHENPFIGNMWHSFVHVLGSIGHLCIGLL